MCGFGVRCELNFVIVVVNLAISPASVFFSWRAFRRETLRDMFDPFDEMSVLGKSELELTLLHGALAHLITGTYRTDSFVPPNLLPSREAIRIKQLRWCAVTPKARFLLRGPSEDLHLISYVVLHETPVVWSFTTCRSPVYSAFRRMLSSGT